MKPTIADIDIDQLQDAGPGLAAFRHSLGDLEYLAASIWNSGLLTPLLVWQTDSGRPEHVVIDGRRRLAAIRLLRARLASERPFPLQSVPCVVRKMRLSDALTLVARLRLDPAICLEANRGDEAVLSELFRTANQMSEEEVEQHLGISQSVVSQSSRYVRLLKPEVLVLLRAGAVTKKDADEVLKASKSRRTSPQELEAAQARQARVVESEGRARRRRAAELPPP